MWHEYIIVHNYIIMRAHHVFIDYCTLSLDFPSLIEYIYILIIHTGILLQDQRSNVVGRYVA